jgi:hypothetical protein
VILLLRALVRLLGFLALLALALAGLGFALAALLGDQLGVQLENSAVSRWLERLEGNGTQLLEAVIGGGMVLLGLLLLIGALAPRRERRAVLEQGELGTLDARRHPLAQMFTALAERTRGVTHASAKLRLGRRAHHGRLLLRADRPRTTQSTAVREAVRSDVSDLAAAFGLKTRVHAPPGGRGRRVQ